MVDTLSFDQQTSRMPCLRIWPHKARTQAQNLAILLSPRFSDPKQSLRSLVEVPETSTMKRTVIYIYIYIFIYLFIYLFIYTHTPCQSREVKTSCLSPYYIINTI